MYRNNVELIGFLGSDAETKTTPNGKTVTNLSLATKTSYLKDGERQERTVAPHPGLGPPRRIRRRVQERGSYLRRGRTA